MIIKNECYENELKNSREFETVQSTPITMNLESTIVNRIQDLIKGYLSNDVCWFKKLESVGDIFKSLAEVRQTVIRSERLAKVNRSYIQASPLRQNATILVKNIKKERVNTNCRIITNLLNKSCRLVMIYVQRNEGISFMKHINDTSINLHIDLSLGNDNKENILIIEEKQIKSNETMDNIVSYKKYQSKTNNVLIPGKNIGNMENDNINNEILKNKILKCENIIDEQSDEYISEDDDFKNCSENIQSKDHTNAYTGSTSHITKDNLSFIDMEGDLMLYSKYEMTDEEVEECVKIAENYKYIMSISGGWPPVFTIKIQELICKPYYNSVRLTP